MPKNFNSMHKKSSFEKTKEKAAAVFAAINYQRHSLMSRRPHRSFRATYRRDYRRSLSLPGYLAFTGQVRALIWSNRKLFFNLAAVYSLVTIVFIGIASQETFSQLSSTLNETSGELFSGGWGNVGKAGLLLLSGATGSFSGAPSETQQVYAALISVFLWMTVVWLLRAIMTGSKPLLRDGLYSAGSPLVATLLVIIVMVIQCLPAAIGVILYSAGISTDLLSEGAVAMLIFAGAMLLVVLSVYLLVSSFFALIIVTLPGMYPWRAIRAAGDLVIGRRLRIIYRIAWMLLVVAMVWTVVMLPLVLLGTWMQGVVQLAWIPLVPIALVIMSSISLIFACTYIYLLYRKVVDDDSAPA